jgi:hypothetical protein
VHRRVRGQGALEERPAGDEGAPEKTGLPDSVGLPVKVPARLPPAARAAVPLAVMFPEKTGLPVKVPDRAPELTIGDVRVLLARVCVELAPTRAPVTP